MKLTIARQDLLDAVSRVKTVVSPKSALPILSHILVEAEDSRVKLTATDLKVSIECTAECSVEEPGSMTVSAQRISSILSELPESDVTVELEENQVVSLSCGKIHTKLYSMSPEEFPPVRSFDEVEGFTLAQGVLRNLFRKTRFAICTDQARYNLTGLLFEIKGGTLTVVATDGRRMSLCQSTESIPPDMEVKVIIPGKMIDELERLLGEDEQVSIQLDESQAGFEFGGMRLVTALIEGTFPNYEMVVPKKHDKELVAESGLLLEAVRRTRTMTNEKFNSVKFSTGEGSLVLRVQTPEVGEYEEELAVSFEGEPMEIAFNPDFLSDVLRRLDSERVSVSLKDGTSPGLFREVSEEGVSDSYVNVIMPIRI